MLTKLLRTSKKTTVMREESKGTMNKSRSSSVSSMRDFLLERLAPVPSLDSYRTLQGLERTTVGIGASDLVLHGDGASWSLSKNGVVKILANGVITSETFRNCFFYSPWVEYTTVHRLFLRVNASGQFRLRVFISAPNRRPECLVALLVDAQPNQASYHRLPDLDGLWKDGRLFWDIKPVSGAVDLHDISYVTDEPAPKEKTFLFLGRTFGRTKALVRVLSNVVDQCYTDDHSRFLSMSKFVILDTSSKSLDEYEHLISNRKLNLFVCSGENLGGGGNAAQVLNIFLQQDDDVRALSDNIVIFDDDLDITVETLMRYQAFASYMVKDVIVTLPVLMKSDPHVVWEDGGVWGRFNESGGRVSSRTEVFPQLIKHGYRLGGCDHLDTFAKLNHPEYSTFIFFAMPRCIVEKLRFPAPFFLRGDDIEYSLRAGRENYKILSNPNMCAWHEPAHSYGQEYMAILHGIIINFSYGELNPASYLKFFNDRFHSHGGIRDGVGLRVYAEVLKSLVAPEAILALGFEHHYFEKLALFKSLDSRFENMDSKIVSEFLSKETSPRRQLYPFVYFNPGPDQVSAYVLHNHHQGTYLFRDLSDPASDIEFYACAAEFSSALKLFIENFDSISNLFRTKLGDSVKDTFWQAQIKSLSPLSKSTFYNRTRSSQFGGPSDKTSIDVDRDYSREAPFLPVDFDPVLYIRINEDVAASDMSPADHYLKFGWREGRRWR